VAVSFFCLMPSIGGDKKVLNQRDSWLEEIQKMTDKRQKNKSFGETGMRNKRISP
jgi:hypothetical protein